MAEPLYSVLQVFPPIEAVVKSYLPTCTFYLGEDQRSRNASPPKVIWDIDGGSPGQPADTSSIGYPRVFAADAVALAAICSGEGKVNAALGEEELRRAEFGASEHLAAVVRWALRKAWPVGLQVTGWVVEWPDGPQERTVPVEVDFSVVVRLLAPAPPTVQPETFQHTGEIEAGV